MKVDIRWIKAHQNTNNREAKLNDMADEMANKGRIEAKGLPPLAQFLSKDLSPIVIVMENFEYKGEGERYIADGIRKQMQEINLKFDIIKWSKLKRQGKIINKHKEETITMAKTIKKHGTSQLMGFFMLAVCDWLPCYDNLSRGRQGKFCTECDEPKDDTAHLSTFSIPCIHFFFCMISTIFSIRSLA